MFNVRLGPARLHGLAALGLLGGLWLSGPIALAEPLRDLLVATQLDRAVAVKKLLDAGASPNTVDPVSGETLLIVALREGADQVVDALLARKDLELERTAPNGNNALMMAAFKRNKRAVLALLAKGAIVTRPGWTALHYAAASGDDEITRLLLTHHAYIDAESPSQLTPLMIAAREGHDTTARVLLDEGADATLKNNEALTAAQIAVRAGHTGIAESIAAHLAMRRSARP